MLRRASGIFGRVLLLGIVALVALWAGVAWRLARGPLPLPFLDPFVEQALGNLGPELVGEFDGTVLAASSRLRLPELRIMGLRLRRADGTLVGLLPELAVRPSARGFLRGRLAVAAIGLSGIRLRIVRDASGRVSLGSAGTAEEEGGEISPELLALAGGGGDGNGDYLRRIRVHDAEIVFDDRLAGRVWKAGRAEVDLSRGEGSVSGRLWAELVMEGTPRAATLPLTADGAATFDEAGGLDSLHFVVTGANGKLAASGSRAAIAVRSFEADGVYLAAAETIELRRVHVAAGDATLDATARLSLAAPVVDITGTVRDLKAGELDVVWPAGAAPGARQWVLGNVHSGRVKSGSFTVRSEPNGAGGARIADGGLEIEIAFDDASVDYLHPLQPLTAARGHVTVTEKGLDVRVAAAKAGELRVSGGTMRAAFGGNPTIAVVVVDGGGPTGPLLAFLDSPPLGYPSRFGLPTTGVGGASEVHVELRFPLGSPSARSDLRVTATAALRDTSLPSLAGVTGTKNGDFDVRLDGGRLEIRGKTALAAAAVSGPLDVEITFDPARPEGEDPLRANVRGEGVSASASATVAENGVETVTIDHFRHGATDLAARMTSAEDGRARVSVTGRSLDLEPLIDRVREEGEGSLPVERAFDLDFQLERVTARGIELSGVRGQAQGDRRGLRSLSAAGLLQGGGNTKIALTEAGDERRISLSSTQAGRVLKALGASAHVVGGSLSVEGKITGRGQGSRVDGSAEMSDFRVVDGPVLAQILSVGSFDGVADMVSGGDGIAFARARLPFRWSEGVITVTDGRAVGSIGITADGTIDWAARKIEVNGDVIPAYTLNAALGKLPFVGEYLVGGKDGGVFGIRYRVSGKLESPEVETNALTALAPRALRQMFVDPFASP